MDVYDYHDETSGESFGCYHQPLLFILLPGAFVVQDKGLWLSIVFHAPSAVAQHCYLTVV